VANEAIPSWLAWLVAALVALVGVSVVEHYNARAGLILALVILFGALGMGKTGGRSRADAFGSELQALQQLLLQGPGQTVRPPGPPTGGGGGGGPGPSLPPSPGGYVNPFPGAQWTPNSHGGELALDVFAPSGSPVYAPVGGRVVSAIYSLGGNTATLYGTDGLVYYFAHFLGPSVSGVVSAGEQIGQVGNSGNARTTPSHTHFAISDPQHGISGAGTGTIAPWTWLQQHFGR